MKNEQPKESPPTHEEVKAALMTCIKANISIEMSADLSIYRAEEFYVVSYIGDEPIKGMNLAQRRELVREGECSIYCETPEEAAEVFLKLREEKYPS
jgi:hypothetical protein